jgi:multiple sugar transport system permease protein
MDALKWAASPKTVMMTIILFSIWKNMGYYMVIYLAGLQGINSELYEAGSLDGANAWQKFRYITLPQLRPTTFFVTIILTINCFKIYDIVYMLAGGSSGIINKSAIVIVYYVYEEAFRNWKLGRASAAALVLFAIVLLITLIQFRGEKNYAND